MLGSIAHLTKQNKNLRVIIASGDMDTLQCVDKKRVEVFTLKRGINDTVLYDEVGVKNRFGFGPALVPDYKGLRGDTSDNIPGIVGIGEKTATELITNFGSIEKIYKTLEGKNGEQKFLDAGIKPRIIKLLQEGKEDAEFSKMLATIRVDALESFTVEDTEWKVNGQIEDILTLFSEFGFRNMGDRVKRLFDVELIDTAVLASEVSERDLEEARILLWLLESERTNASYDDIIEYGRAFLNTDTFVGTKAALEEKVKTEGLWKLYETTELPLIDVLQDMKAIGIKLDVPYLEKLSKTLHKEIASLEKSIYKHAGGEFNINSPKQLGDVLFDTLELKPKNAKKTAGGQRSTKESELQKMKDDHPIIADILRYRELQKLVSTYIDALPKEVGDDGRVHSTLIQTGAATGRMASKDPNLQNIPVRSEEGRAIRGAFIASDGYELVAIDYSQIELRIAAMLSEDPALVDIFKRGEDVHTGVAVRVFKVDANEVTPNMRRKAKVINFGILYGMGVNALRQNLQEGQEEEVPRAEAQEFLNAYFNTFTRLAEYLEETKSYAAKHGYTETMFGRRRKFAGITSSVPFIRAQAERMAINAPIQGTEGDILRIAQLNIYNWIKAETLENDVRMLLQVHDELVFEIKKDKLKTAIPKLVDIMTSVFEGKEKHGVPVEVEVKVGKNWLEMEKQDSLK